MYFDSILGGFPIFHYIKFCKFLFQLYNLAFFTANEAYWFWIINKKDVDVDPGNYEKIRFASDLF